MKNLLLIIVFSIFSNVIFCQLVDNTFQPTWATCLGQPESEYEVIHNSILHSDGLVFNVGWTMEIPQHEGGQQDLFYTCVDAVDGNELYYKIVNFSSVSDILHGVAESSDNTIIAVGIIGGPSTEFPSCEHHGSADIVVLRINPVNGEIINIRTIGGSQLDRAYSVSSLEDGNLIIVGKTESNDDDFENFSLNGGVEAFIIKLDYEFNIIWSKCIGSANDDTFNKIITDNGGFGYAVGTSEISNKNYGLFTKFNVETGDIVSQKVYSSSYDYMDIVSITIDDESNLFMCGHYFDSYPYPNHILPTDTTIVNGSFILKTNNNGIELNRLNRTSDVELTGSYTLTYPYIGFNDILFVDNLLTIGGALNTRQIGFYFYNKNLEKVYESSYNTTGTLTNIRSVLFDGEYLYACGVAIVTFHTADYFSNYGGGFYDAIALKVKKSTALNIETNLQNIDCYVYPNPVSDWAEFDYNSEPNQEYKIEIYNSMGVFVESYKLSDNNNHIDFSNYSAGLYFYFIDDVKTGKFIKL